jgi:hypothetical protein
MKATLGRGRAMGRGRAKAKQTKVARELKYSGPSTDLDALQRELSAGGHSTMPVDDVEDVEDDEDYSQYLDDEDE